jgi:hypothetical protein
MIKMKHIKKFESYRVERKREEIIKESVLQVNDIYKVKSMIDIPQSLINAYVKKVKDNTGKNLRQFFGDMDIAEEIVKHVAQAGIDADKIPATALVGGSQIQGQTQPQGQAQTQPQGQAQTEPQAQAQPMPQTQAQPQVQVQTESQPQAQAQGGDGFEEVAPEGQAQPVQAQPQAQSQAQSQAQPEAQGQGQAQEEEEEETGEEELPA